MKIVKRGIIGVASKAHGGGSEQIITIKNLGKKQEVVWQPLEDHEEFFKAGDVVKFDVTLVDNGDDELTPYAVNAKVIG